MQKTTYPMHSAQRDIYVDQLINKESPLYNIGGYIKWKGNLDLEKFHEAVNSASEVFDAFKMIFDFDSDELTPQAKSTLNELIAANRKNKIKLVYFV